jgi:hypothetical protein
MSADDKILKSLISRVDKLERAVFRPQKAVADEKLGGAKKNYAGATGGIRLLADSGYFDKKRTFGEVCKALEDKGYVYSKQAVQTPLNLLSSVKSGLLVGLKERGRKVYAKRK